MRAARAARWSLAVGLGSTCLLLSACRARIVRAPEPLRVPLLETRILQHCGVPLGPVAPAGTAETLDPSGAGALRVAVTLEHVERWPGQSLAPLALGARLVSAEQGGEPIETRPQIAEAGRVAVGAPAQELGDQLTAGVHGRTARACDESVVLLLGTTVEVVAVSDEQIDVAYEGLVRRQLSLQIGRPGGADGPIRVALLTERVSGAAGAPELGNEESVRRRELVLLGESPSVDGGPLAIVLQSPLERGEAEALVAFIRVRSEPCAESAVAEAIRRCAEAERLATQRTAWLAPSAVQRRQREQVVAALRRPADQRAALCVLSQLTAAPIAGDLALSADDAALQAFASRVDAELAAAPDAGADLSVLGWCLERAAIVWLAATKASEPLPPELEAVLVRQTGELGRSAHALEDLLRTCASLEELRAKLVVENRIFLEDGNTAVRVRACDWLATRGLAPRGFDPLAGRAERRAALEAADEQP